MSLAIQPAPRSIGVAQSGAARNLVRSCRASPAETQAAHFLKTAALHCDSPVLSEAKTQVIRPTTSTVRDLSFLFSWLVS